MKVLIVSAHFPPNFVSGGTLAPERIARALMARGHEVGIYAGWMGNEPDLRTWTEVADGLPVRWLSLNPWPLWPDDRNYTNPAAASDFGQYLGEARPDVVHFHSLQGLGADLLDVAADRGATVVVTMHDFWWICARQFLVDRQYQPCCLVVLCGECECERGRAWLDQRNRYLAKRLDRADAILTVSRTAARVLEANGIATGRIFVDVNGMVEADTARSPAPARRLSTGREPPTTVRFAYAGGPDRMKGVHVLLAACRSLAGLGGWQLTAYGAGPFVTEEGIVLAGMPVDVRPPFPPEQAGEVLSDADVLVVPSVMRESYSLLTREALSRGVPVIVTDTLGPEEVVEHGVNGLVVPAADPQALAAAIGAFVEDPALLGRLRAGCGQVPLRSVDEQVAGLEELYGRLLAGRQGTGRGTIAPARRPVRRVVFAAGIHGAPLRYRARLPAEALALLGVESEVRHYLDPELPALVARADAFVVYRVPATVQFLELLAATRARGTPIFFDVDDLIFDPDLEPEIPALKLLPPDEATLWMQGVRRYRTTMEACDAYIGSTDALCRHAEATTGLPAHRLDNGVGLLLGQLSDRALARPRSPGRVRIGYLSGTNTHDDDWRHVEPVIVDLLKERDDVELWLGGLVNPSEELEAVTGGVRRLPLLPWWELPSVLRDLDVNLAPLEPGSRFNEAKSAIKWLEAALTATITVASPTEPFREVIRPAENGFLAGDLDEWRACLGQALTDAAERDRLGRQARRDALLDRSPHRQGQRYLEILAAGTIGRRRPSAWVGEALDEPPAPVALEEYGFPPDEDAGEVAGVEEPQTARSLVARARESVLEEGFGVTARRAIGWAGRRWPDGRRRLNRLRRRR